MKKTIRQWAALLIAAVSILVAQSAQAQTDELKQAIEAIKQVDKHGAGHEPAVQAMRVLNSASVDQVPEILAGMDGANRLATNWLRSAVVSIVGRADAIPIEQIKSYFENPEGSQLGRLMAFDLLDETNEGWAESIVPDLIDDPSLPLRRKAVKSWIAKAKKAELQESLGILATALEKARDVDQVQQIANLLGEKGVAIDLQKQLGFLGTWQLVGAFDNKSESGFDVPAGPELALDNIDLMATYTDMDSKEVTWSQYTTAEPTGVVDLNDAIGNVKGATAYCFATFLGQEDRPCEIRIGCINAHKVWVNGELIASNEIYHNGISPDKFSAPAKIRKGENQILVKVCQNEQTEPWAQRWQFQLRICDETGKAIQPAKPAPARD